MIFLGFWKWRCIVTIVCGDDSIASNIADTNPSLTRISSSMKIRTSTLLSTRVIAVWRLHDLRDCPRLGVLRFLTNKSMCGYCSGLGGEPCS